MSEPTRVHDYVSVRGRFHRSVNLVQDWRGHGGAPDYIVTPTVREIAERMLDELARPNGARAWSITGPYGSGKSAFGLFLADVLASRRPAHPDAAGLRKRVSRLRQPLLPVFAIAERAPLHVTLARALAEAVAPLDQALARTLRRMAKAENSAGAVAAATRDVLRAAREAGFGGVLLVLDEVGKFLEHAADNDLDLFILQQIAEDAARHRDPFVFVTVLHSAFADYLQVGDDVRRAEWQKVQGRFHDVPFQLPAEQLLGLVGHSLHRSVWPRDLHAAWDHVVKTTLSQLADAGALGGMRSDRGRHGGLQELLGTCYPFHPTTALLLWPLFRSKLAQNERSLFAFLTSYEPHGFREFLGQPAWNGRALRLFSLGALYDYVTHALGVAAFRGEQARKWSLVEHAVTRLPSDAPVGAAELVKVVGLLMMYGPAAGLPPSADVLSVCGVPDTPDVLRYLTDRSILVFRRHTGAYALWEGSDVDLEDAYGRARAQRGGQSLATRLARLLNLRPVVARAHYIERGTLRLLEPVVVDAHPDALHTVLQRPFEGDGRIVYVVTPSATLQQELRGTAEHLTRLRPERLDLVAFPHLTHGVTEALEELEAWQWIRDNLPDIAGDPVARQEVAARLDAARERFARVTGPLFGLPGYVFDPAASRWVAAGQSHAPGSARAFQQWLSQQCERVYASAPVLRNELINRSSLSSAVSAARRNLLERLLTHEAAPGLGIEGSPPEAVIYASLLRDTGIHASRASGEFALGRPETGPWQPVWDAIETFFDAAVGMHAPVTALYDRLSSAPFGLRDGVVSTLVATALIVRRDTVALYEDGLFVTDFRIEVLERLLRRPDTFAVQSLRLTPVQQLTLRMLRQHMQPGGSKWGQGDAPESSSDLPPRQASVGARDAQANGAAHSNEVFEMLDAADAPLPGTTDVSAAADLVPVARLLVSSVAQLPPYARRTTRMSPEAIAVRAAVLKARDPRELLFEQLPHALGTDSESTADAREFMGRLLGALSELTSAYPKLLLEVERQVRDAFALGASATPFADLQARARPVARYATDRSLKLFLSELLAERPRDDWREALARASRGGMPPAQWSDADVREFSSQLHDLTAEFSRLLTLADAKAAHGAQQVVRIDVLGDDAGAVAPVVIALTADLDVEVQATADRILALLGPAEEEIDPTRLRQIRLAALARVAAGVASGALVTGTVPLSGAAAKTVSSARNGRPDKAVV